MNNTKVMTGMDKTSTSKEVKNCLVVLYAPYETGAPEFILRIRKYENAGQALWAYAETPCCDSILVDEETAKLIASMESEIIHSIKAGMMLEEALTDWDLIA